MNYYRIHDKIPAWISAPQVDIARNRKIFLKCVVKHKCASVTWDYITCELEEPTTHFVMSVVARGRYTTHALVYRELSLDYNFYSGKLSYISKLSDVAKYRCPASNETRHDRPTVGQCWHLREEIRTYMLAINKNQHFLHLKQRVSRKPCEQDVRHHAKIKVFVYKL